MKLIAIHEIVRKVGTTEPGKPFEAEGDEAEFLLNIGAARKAAEQPVEAEAPKRGRKAKDEAEDSVI